ncbi:hypothetical protein [Lentzea aerocolonigenes]|uniref:hypothetical protein n=1 Tax=Lentzea aerocolonigenes TaxID=68170 RepID=UPI0012E0FB20|nr:hypothetical protein [Lentzea aerocolonigenes]
MIAYIELARAANVATSGELNLLGAGWDTIGPAPLPAFSVIATINDSDQSDARSFDIWLRLVDSEGQIVSAGDENSRLIEYRTSVQTSNRENRPPGISGGARIMIDLQNGLPLTPGLYRWILTAEGSEWSRAFFVREKEGEYAPIGRNIE